MNLLNLRLQHELFFSVPVMFHGVASLSLRVLPDEDPAGRDGLFFD
ncbi:MAG: hypothetical protein PUK77_04240 [bacterium]|nr:hypothetical protein [bacterium]